MEIPSRELVALIARVWNDEYPLVRKYFGKYLHKLINADLSHAYKARSLFAAFKPIELEQRLCDLEPFGITQKIVNEVSLDQEPEELDRRLMDAWAELRAASQLVKEGYGNINKIDKTGDLIAEKNGNNYVFQITRINKSLATEIERRNNHEDRDTSPYGDINNIYKRFHKPLSYYFWEKLEDKNSIFKKWEKPRYRRCIVIITFDESLQDPVVRQIACKCIRDGIHDLVDIFFTRLYWFPDLSNGAVFYIGKTKEKTWCAADWQDDPALHRNEKVRRKKVDLDALHL